MAHGITAGAGPALPICRGVAIRRRRVASLAIAGRLMQRGVAVRRRRRCIACPGTEEVKIAAPVGRSGQGVRSGLRIRPVPAAMHGAISQDLCEIAPKRLSPAVHQTAQPARDPEQQHPGRERYDDQDHEEVRLYRTAFSDSRISSPGSPPADWPRSSKPHPHEHRGHGDRRDANTGTARQRGRRPPYASQRRLGSYTGRLLAYPLTLRAGQRGWEVVERAKTRTF